MTHSQDRLAVVLMNLGGPDTLDAVRPYLKNLFSDPAIISLPWPLRPLVAEVISRTRTPSARQIYEQMGGRSPLLENTKAQSLVLKHVLQEQLADHIVETFIAMRYWHPLTIETVDQVKAFQPSEIILLTLYPQFSKTTTGSSFTEWYKQAKNRGLSVPTREVRSYPYDPSFIEAHAQLLTPWIKKASIYGKPRILFSAHGLPQKVIDAGDPYEKQVHQTVEAILKKIPSEVEGVVCYQSKVGPLKWLEPSTEYEIRRAGKEKTPVIIVPVAFVSEHGETLIELDRDYQRLALDLGVPFYGRVPSLGVHPAYINALVGLVINTKNKDKKNG